MKGCFYTIGLMFIIGVSGCSAPKSVSLPLRVSPFSDYYFKTYGYHSVESFAATEVIDPRTKKEIRAILGPPHIRRMYNSEWIYVGFWYPAGTLLRFRFREDIVYWCLERVYDGNDYAWLIPELIESLRDTDADIRERAFQKLLDLLQTPTSTAGVYSGTPFDPENERRDYEGWRRWWEDPEKFWME